jgi:hypothetical protein
MIYIENESWNLGRTGNKMFIHAFGNFIAEKNNLYWQSEIQKEFPDNEITTRFHDGFKKEIKLNITDEICADFIEKKIESGAKIHGWFQESELVNNEEYAKYLSSIFKINEYLPIDTDSVFIHIRAGDISEWGRRMLPLDYYENQLNSISFKHGAIATDSFDHPIVQALIKKYNFKKFIGTAEQTIKFGASHSKIILSLGTFSYWIGVLSKPGSIIKHITMNNAITDYSLIWWHPNFNLEKTRNYVDTRRTK